MSDFRARLDKWAVPASVVSLAIWLRHISHRRLSRPQGFEIRRCPRPSPARRLRGWSDPMTPPDVDATVSGAGVVAKRRLSSPG